VIWITLYSGYAAQLQANVKISEQMKFAWILGVEVRGVGARPMLAQWLVHWNSNIRLVLGCVTTREDCALWTSSLYMAVIVLTWRKNKSTNQPSKILEVLETAPVAELKLVEDDRVEQELGTKLGTWEIESYTVVNLRMDERCAMVKSRVFLSLQSSRLKGNKI